MFSFKSVIAFIWSKSNGSKWVSEEPPKDEGPLKKELPKKKNPPKDEGPLKKELPKKKEPPRPTLVPPRRNRCSAT